MFILTPIACFDFDYLISAVGHICNLTTTAGHSVNRSVSQTYSWFGWMAKICACVFLNVADEWIKSKLSKNILICHLIGLLNKSVHVRTATFVKYEYEYLMQVMMRFKFRQPALICA